MLDQLRIAVLGAKASTIYGIVASVLVAVYFLGVWSVTSSRADICAEDIVEAEKQRARAQELNEQLTLCDAQCAVNDAINCEVVCAEQVASALSDAHAWACTN